VELLELEILVVAEVVLPVLVLQLAVVVLVLLLLDMRYKIWHTLQK
jgi:hypothetical protein